VDIGASMSNMVTCIVKELGIMQMVYGTKNYKIEFKIITIIWIFL
jgi:hypothetical protein